MKNITSREQEVLHLIAHEHSSKEIAQKLYVSYETIHSHRKNIMTKLGVRNTAGMVRVAFERQLLRVTLSVVALMCWGISTHAQELHLDVEGDARIVGKVNVINAVGDSSVFIGANAGKNDDGGNSNTFVGGNAGLSNTSGSTNSFFGQLAGYFNTTGSYNSFFGEAAGLFNTNGFRNSFFGVEAGSSNSIGDNNSFFGVAAGFHNSIGNNNSFFGVEAGSSNTTGEKNSFFGLSAGSNNTIGGRNSFFGETTGFNNTTGVDNAYFGESAGYSNNNTRSTLLGAFAMTLDSLDRAIAIGYDAQVNCHKCAVIGGTGDNTVNVGIGTTTPESELTIKQRNSGSNYGIRLMLANDDYWNTFVDSGKDYNFAYKGVLKAYIKDDTGEYIESSDRRLKNSITPVQSILGDVLRLRPTTYYYNSSKSRDRRSWGFVAQEVQKVFPDFVSEKDGYLGIAYDNFGVVAIKAIQEQQVIIEQQNVQLENQQSEISLLKDRLSKLESMIKQAIQK